MAISKYKELIQEYLSLPTPIFENSPILIYGAGRAGQAVANFLSRKGHTIAGFLDKNAKPGQSIENIPVVTLSDWLTKHDPENYSVIIAVLSVDYWGELRWIEQSIRQFKFRCVLNFHQFYYAFPQALPEEHRYVWLIPHATLLASCAKLDQLDSILSDEKSRRHLESIIRFRLSGNYALLPQATPQELYRPHDLPRWPESLRFIDCGAFTGDTLLEFTQNGYAFEAIAAFEPDPENYQKLVENTTQYKDIIRIPCALGARTEIVRFNTAGDMSSHIVGGALKGRDTGKGLEESSIQCISLDEALPSFAPNLIKMDIESFEPDALQGARRMIMQHQPGLAISIYHLPEQLWSIPLMINEWQNPPGGQSTPPP